MSSVRRKSKGRSSTGKKKVSKGSTKKKKPTKKMASKSAPIKVKAEEELKCGTCGKGFDDNATYITALGGVFHEDHFRCAHCNKALADSEEPVYSCNGKPYCEPDYLTLFAKTCAACSKEIVGKFFNAMDKEWHEACLACAKCQTSLVGQPIYFKSVAGKYKNGDPVYCQKDFQELHGETCAGCGDVLVGKILRALDAKWHPDCFTCAECAEPLGAKFYVQNDHVYCKHDYEELFGTKCAVCKEIVKGACLKEQDNTYHKECFVCSHCKEPLDTKQFFKEEDNVYCLKDYEMLYATRCAGCNQYVTGTVLHVLDKDWHRDCFVCCECREPLEDGFLKKDDKVYCEKDYSRLFDKICSGCEEVIDGQYVEVLDFCWHKDCFLCTTCMQPITSNECYVQDNKVYCADDFMKLIAEPPKKSAAPGQQITVTKNKMPGSAPAKKKKKKRGATFNTKSKRKGLMKIPTKGKISVTSKELAANKLSPRQRRARRLARAKRGTSGATQDQFSTDKVEKKERAAPVDDDEEDSKSSGLADTLASLLAKGVRTSLARSKRLFRKDFQHIELYKVECDKGLMDFYDYAPSIFQCMRQQYGISTGSWSDSLCSKDSIQVGKAGKKMFFYTKDTRFLIRSISVAETKFLLKIFQKYFRHMTRNHHSLLPRFFGLFKIKVPRRKKLYRFIVTNNVFDTDLPISVKFDLKAATISKKKAIKDKEFDGKIRMGDKQGQAFKQQLNRDCTFLKSAHIIDQGLLLGVSSGSSGLKGKELASSKHLMRPLLPHPVGGKERGLVTVFQQNHGGTRAFKGSKPLDTVYFVGIVNILQELDLKRKKGSRGRFNKEAAIANESKKFTNQFQQYISDLVE